MKRIISLFLCLILFVSLFSCESSTDELSKGEEQSKVTVVSDDQNGNGLTSNGVSSEDSSVVFDNESENDVNDGSETSKPENGNDENSTDDSTDVSDGDDGDDETDVSDGENTDEDENGNDGGETSKPEDEPEVCKHKSTKIINKKEATTSSEGYTGDKVCADCGTLIKKGEKIEKLKETVQYVTYTNAYGDKITVPDDVDVLQYTLAQANKTATSEAPDVEAEILRLTNIERVNAGLQPLKNETGAYYFAKLRAQECHESFSHTRPNGKGFHTVFCDEKVFYVYAGENLAKCTNYEYEDYASVCVEGWMNSEGHRANILNPKFTSIAIATVIVGNTQCSVQLFFGKP